MKIFLSVVTTLFLFACSTPSSTPVSPNSSPVDRSAKLNAAKNNTDIDEVTTVTPLPPTEMPPIATPTPKSRYQVMEEGFSHSAISPVVSDFDRLDEAPARMRCYSAKSAAPNVVSEMVIKQMSVPISATADYGPLFPGSPQHDETRLVIGKNNGWVNSANLTPEIRQVFELIKAPSSLIIQIKENKFGIYQDIGAPAEVWLRKDAQNHIFFKVFRLNSEKVRNEVFIGYCFL